MASRRMLMRHPRALGLNFKGLRTQAMPDEREVTKLKRNFGLKGRTVLEITRVREGDFDHVTAMQQEMRTVLKVRELLIRRPGRLMDMAELSTRHPHFAEAVLNFPDIFNVIDYGTGSSLVCLTAEAEALLNLEDKLKEETEASSLRAIRKILMLSVEKRLPLRKLDLLAMDLGMPCDFSDLVSRHRNYFKLSTTLDYTTWVSLASWDPELAVSYAEIDEKQRIDGTMSQMEMWAPKGYILSKRHRKILARFREAPFVSPFSDFRDLEPLKIRFEKHAVAGMQELLNLTLHKSLLLNSLAEFKTEFSFSNKPLDLVLRHPEYFYASPVGEQETVFLRSAYRSGELVRKSSLASIREQLARLLGAQKIQEK